MSSHFFSADGKVWQWSDAPYGHTVVFDDGTWHSFCTLERPNLSFNAAGLITHINFAADLITGNEGCAARGKGCVDCKLVPRACLAAPAAPRIHATQPHPPTPNRYDDHAGSLVVALGAQ